MARGCVAPFLLTVFGPDPRLPGFRRKGLLSLVVVDFPRHCSSEGGDTDRQPGATELRATTSTLSGPVTWLDAVILTAAVCYRTWRTNGREGGKDGEQIR